MLPLQVFSLSVSLPLYISVNSIFATGLSSACGGEGGLRSSFSPAIVAGSEVSGRASAFADLSDVAPKRAKAEATANRPPFLKSHLSSF